jgi:hypothetical protein
MLSFMTRESGRRRSETFRYLPKRLARNECSIDLSALAMLANSTSPWQGTPPEEMTTASPKAFFRCFRGDFGSVSSLQLLLSANIPIYAVHRSLICTICTRGILEPQRAGNLLPGVARRAQANHLIGALVDHTASIRRRQAAAKRGVCLVHRRI